MKLVVNYTFMVKTAHLPCSVFAEGNLHQIGAWTSGKHVTLNNAKNRLEKLYEFPEIKLE